MVSFALVLVSAISFFSGKNDSKLVKQLAKLNCQKLSNLAIFVFEASSFQCHQCAAENQESCNATITKQGCRANQVCLTMTYTEPFSGITRKWFIKRCADGSKHCDNNCQLNGEFAENCEVEKRFVLDPYFFFIVLQVNELF